MTETNKQTVSDSQKAMDEIKEVLTKYDCVMRVTQNIQVDSAKPAEHVEKK
jgi:hypothetical protein